MIEQSGLRKSVRIGAYILCGLVVLYVVNMVGTLLFAPRATGLRVADGWAEIDGVRENGLQPRHEGNHLVLQWNGVTVTVGPLTGPVRDEVTYSAHVVLLNNSEAPVEVRWGGLTLMPIGSTSPAKARAVEGHSFTFPANPDKDEEMIAGLMEDLPKSFLSTAEKLVVQPGKETDFRVYCVGPPATLATLRCTVSSAGTTRDLTFFFDHRPLSSS